MKKEYSAGVIVFHESVPCQSSDRKYLILHYRKGHWDLAKGKLEAEESTLDAALRELKEETNLTVEILPHFQESLTYIFKGHEGHLINKEVTFFIGRATYQEVLLSHEHLAYKWLSLKDALKQVTYANAQQILRLADEFIETYCEK